MHRSHLVALFLSPGLAAAASTLLRGGTIISFNRATESLEVIRNGSVLVTDDRIANIFGSTPPGSELPEGTEEVDITDKILTTGFIDTHRHGWQTAFKTLGSNTSLVEYFNLYGEFANEGLLNADDVYIGQLAGLYEALNAGVTTTVDHAHHTWSDETAEAGLRASIDSGARVFWCYAFHSLQNFTVNEQLANFRALATNASFQGTPTSLGIAYDSFGPNPNLTEVDAIVGLTREFNISVLTTHSLQGPWDFDNSPETFAKLSILDLPLPIIFSHASFLTARGATLLRAANQYISVTPESELHYGHLHPTAHHALDQAALGVDTHFTFSTDILTQARLWLQTVRRTRYEPVLQDLWHPPVNNPMSVNQAFLLATRNGGLALKRDDLGVLAAGAKADLIVWNGASPGMLGWVDPVAAVVLHANVGDVEGVMVDGRWRKRDGRIADEEYYTETRGQFLESARRIQRRLIETPLPVVNGSFMSGYTYGTAERVDTLRGEGDGYGELFLEV
ncbi:hypothetical protein MFIFM68171_07266 [Madurella fahalii]|uniref:Amidohydrolase-related domain-containing protein n=1 Tax=Madurella fahalii TaxID=1157608 RepID=A0ABQ0GH24_9PEZI